MESNHVIPRYQRGAVTVWLTPLVSTQVWHWLRHASRWWPQERSNLLLPGFNRPLHRQSFRTVGLLENRAIEGVRPGGHSLDR